MATKVLKNGTVMAFDEASEKMKVLREGSILIVGDITKAIEQGFTSSPDAEVIDCANKLVSLGFVNTHLHLWQTAYRSIAPDVTLVHYFDWLSQQSKLAQTAFTPLISTSVFLMYTWKARMVE